MAALRKLSSPSKTEQPPLKSILKKRKARSPSYDSDDAYQDDNDMEPFHISKKVAYRPHDPSLLPSSKIVKQQQQHHQPPSYRTSRLNGTFLSDGKGKRRALFKQESSVDDLELHPKHARFAASLATANEPCKCKFAKAGCPFTGSQDEVKKHEDSYCSPLYRQLAYFKMLANRSSTSGNSPHPSTSKLPPISSNSSAMHEDMSPYTTMITGRNARSEPPSSPTKDTQEESIDPLKIHIHRLQTDLQRAQSQLEEEKNLRTERLRKASERCLELMSLSELGEGKVEVLSMKLKAERELREKLEEELESVRAERIAQGILRY